MQLLVQWFFPFLFGIMCGENTELNQEAESHCPSQPCPLDLLFSLHEMNQVQLNSSEFIGI